MLPPRYQRRGSDFWPAYWFHEKGYADIADRIPEVITPGWWRGVCVNHVTSLMGYVVGYAVAKGDPNDAALRHAMERSLESWYRIGIECPTGEGFDGMEYEQSDLVRWYSPELKRVMRMAIAVRHVYTDRCFEWYRSDTRFFNRTVSALGYEFKNWGQDFSGGKNRWEWEVSIPEGSETYLLLMGNANGRE